MAKFCMAKTTVRHEEFSCDLYVYQHEQDEDRPHEWRGGVWPPCPECCGLDLHKPGCKEAVKFGAQWPPASVVWKDGQKPKVMRSYVYEAEATRNR